MRFSLCNEVIRDLEFSAQCAFAQKAGYEGLEVAPFTLAENPHLIGTAERQQLRRTASDAGIEITSLHWLLVAPKGLSITTSDPAVRKQTIEVMRRLVGLCADLGAKTLVHGSPQQRNVAQGEDRQEVMETRLRMFRGCRHGGSVRRHGLLHRAVVNS